MASPPRKIGSFGAGRKHTARGSLRFLPGGAGSGASPDRSDGEGQGSVIPCPSPNTKVGSAAEGTEGSAPETEFNMVGRKATRVWMDKFAFVQVTREYQLRPMETLVLMTLVFLADWRSKAYVGTLSELAVELRLSKSALSKALAGLQDHGLITVTEPFTRHVVGTVLIDCYNRFAETPPSHVRGSLKETLRTENDSKSGDEQRLRDSSKELRNKGAIKEEGSESRDAVGRLRQAFPGAEEVS